MMTKAGNNILLLLMGMLSCLPLKAQQVNEKEEAVRQAIEFLSEKQEQSMDFTDITFWLDYYYNHPLNLNSADDRQLQQLYLLTPVQVENLLQHRKEFGDLISIYELQAVEGLDLETIDRILPFVKVDEKEGGKYTLKQLLTLGKSQVSLGCAMVPERQQGYVITSANQRFSGSPYGLQFRYEYVMNDRLSYGIVADKDAGEEFFKGSQKQGFDFYSGHLFYNDGGHLKALALGDYQVQIGQGLCIWSSFAFGKTADVMNAARIGRGVFSSRSANAFNFLRGAAAQLNFGKVDFIAFASGKKLDANLVKDSLSENTNSFSSLLLSGYHRNASELEDRNSLTESLGGGAVEYHSDQFKIGWSGLYGGYDKSFAPKEEIYKSSFAGKRFYNTSVYYSWLYRNAYFFGETGWNGKDFAGIYGLIATLDPKLDASMIYRDYGRNYYGPYVNALGENSGNSNEKGLYMALSYRPVPRLQLNAYTDLFRFPWLKFSADAPTKGEDYLISGTYQFRAATLYARYRLQRKEENASEAMGKLNTPVQNNLQHLRLQLNLKAHASLSFASRIELSRYAAEGETPENGFLAFQDMDYAPFKKKWKLSMRYVLFDISSYDARIYTFEDNVQYAFSIPALQDQGIRYYILWKYKPVRGFELSGRLARTRLYDKESYGTGLGQVNVPHHTELRLQLNYSF